MNTTWTRTLVALVVLFGSTVVGSATARAGSDETFGPISFTAGYGAAVAGYSVPVVATPVVSEVPVVSGPTTTFYAPTPTVAAAPVVSEPVTTASYSQPVTTYYAAPVTTYYAPPVTTYYAPAPVTAYYAPVTTYYAPPVTTYYAPSVPVTTYYAPAAAYYAPTVSYYAPTYYYQPVRRGLFRRW